MGGIIVCGGFAEFVQPIDVAPSLIRLEGRLGRCWPLTGLSTSS